MDEEWEQDTNAEVERVLAQYPEAREFLPLITATTVEDFTTVARSISEKVRKLQSRSEQAPRTHSQGLRTGEQVVTVKDAIESRDWSDFLKAKWTEQNEKDGTDG